MAGLHRNSHMHRFNLDGKARDYLRAELPLWGPLSKALSMSACIRTGSISVLIDATPPPKDFRRSAALTTAHTEVALETAERILRDLQVVRWEAVFEHPFAREGDLSLKRRVGPMFVDGFMFLRADGLTTSYEPLAHMLLQCHKNAGVVCVRAAEAPPWSAELGVDILVSTVRAIAVPVYDGETWLMVVGR
jgi:hypothetical protein